MMRRNSTSRRVHAFSSPSIRSEADAAIDMELLRARAREGGLDMPPDVDAPGDGLREWTWFRSRWMRDSRLSRFGGTVRDSGAPGVMTPWADKINAGPTRACATSTW